MSMPDLWSPDAMVPKPRAVVAERVAIVPRGRVEPRSTLKSRPTSIENLPAARDRELLRATAQAWEDGFRVGRMVGETGVQYGEGPPPGAGSMLAICKAVAIKHEMSLATIMGESRAREVIHARHEAIWRCAKETGYSMARIGRHFNLDHSTIINAIRRHEERRLAED